MPVLKIAFHTPLNRYGDGAISGDRRMARQLVTLLERLGHSVEIVPAERSFMREPDEAELSAHQAAAQEVIERLASAWQYPAVRPDLFFTYHCHYRAPDLIGPALVERFALPYLLAEASDAPKRFSGGWAAAATLARDAIQRADLHLCMTARDREGLAKLLPGDVPLVDLPPFLLADGDRPVRNGAARPIGAPARLIVVAMMRKGTKENSYFALARTLAGIVEKPWTLTLIGDGAQRAAVEAAFAGFPPERLRWLGRIGNAETRAELAAHDLFVWPGLNEAYGLVYLEAQAAGLPVAALHSGGVPAVVEPGRTGLLVADHDEAALGETIAALIDQPALRERLGSAARIFAREERNGEAACAILAGALEAATRRHCSRPCGARR
jgi:glycosyltransferase involved in cell wall biosynthesis